MSDMLLGYPVIESADIEPVAAELLIKFGDYSDRVPAHIEIETKEDGSKVYKLVIDTQ